MRITNLYSYLKKLDYRDLLFVAVSTDEGVRGIGECSGAYGVGSGLAVEGALREFAALVRGRDPFRIQELIDTLSFESYWDMHGGPVLYSAMSGIEQALWDIKGKCLNVPVYEFLGGRVRERVKVYANTFATVPWDRAQEYADFARTAVDDGFTALKIYPFGVERMAKDDQEIVDRVRAVRDAVGYEVDLMVDGGWRYCFDTLSAIRIGEKLEEFDLLFLEEPIAPGPGNVSPLAEVRANINIPIAAGEKIHSISEFKQYLDEGAVDIIQPDVGLVGGILGLKKIADMAEQYRVQVSPHSAAGPVATAACMQVSVCSKAVVVVESFPYESSMHGLAQASYEERIEQSYVEIIDEAGLGVVLRDEVMAELVSEERAL